MFDNIIGNDKIKEYLETAISTGEISHSYMFVGISGIGKSLFAREFAKKIICTDEASLVKFDANSNPDYVEIEPEGKTIKIEQIRNIQTKIAEKPIVSQKKVYVINDADSMSEEAQNCLLKTLEEPPEYAIIILVASNESNLLATIKSRCVIVNFTRLTNEQLKKYLKDVPNDILSLLGGSLERVNKIEQIKQEFEELEIIVESLKNKPLTQTLNSADILYTKKEDIMELLNYLNIIFFNQRIIEPIETIEKVKKKIIANNNYEMCIDYLLMHIWEEINEKSYRR